MTLKIALWFMGLMSLITSNFKSKSHPIEIEFAFKESIEKLHSLYVYALTLPTFRIEPFMIK